jgi:hypothetical protein
MYILPEPSDHLASACPRMLNSAGIPLHHPPSAAPGANHATPFVCTRCALRSVSRAMQGMSETWMLLVSAVPCPPWLGLAQAGSGRCVCGRGNLR